MTITRTLDSYDSECTLLILFPSFRALAELVNEHENEWDIYLDTVVFSLRTGMQNTTKYSPFKLLYNREPLHPSQLVEKSDDWTGVCTLL